MQWQKISYALYPDVEKIITICYCKKCKDQLWGPPSYYSMSNLGWHEADQSPPSIAKVKNQWHYTTTTPLAFNVCIGTTLPYFLCTFLHQHHHHHHHQQP